MIKSLAILFLSLLVGLPTLADWMPQFQKQLKKIDSSFDGTLGVYARRLKDGSWVDHNANRPWYLASTVKVLIGISLLKEVEEGKISLEDEIILQKSDYVDGSGEILWKDPGAKLTLGYLLEKMLTQSDSTAADLLAKRVGLDKVNAYTQQWAKNFGPITTLLEVRYRAYEKIHPKARELSNMHFIELKKSPVSRRAQAFAKLVRVPFSQLKIKNLNQGFELYYSEGANSSPLDSFVDVLEKLSKGQILNKANTSLILGHMEKMTTGKTRIKAGLSSTVRFAQKTGTQIARICNVGIITLKKDPKKEVAIAACAEKFKNQKQAEKALSDVGRALMKSGALK